MDGGILVAIDGSPQSFAGLRTALALGRALDKRVEAVAVYDPYLHYAVFNGIVDVLSEKASKIFRFKEQEALHEEIIDTGLAKIYEFHLRVARATAAEEGVDLPITLLDGKAFERVLRHARETRPWLLVLGRIGVHSDAAMDMGSNTEQLLRLAPCNVLVSSGSFTPPIDVRADASVVWTPEAEDRMAAVPGGARGLARTAVLRWAMERGHSVVSSGDVATALDELMPFARVQRRIAETAATVDGAEQAMLEEPPLEDARAVCRTCGYAARSDTPQRCPVCGGDARRLRAPRQRRAPRRRARARATPRQVAFDGAKLGWTVEARRVLQQLPAGYLRRARQGDRREARADPPSAGDHRRGRRAVRRARARRPRRQRRPASRAARRGGTHGSGRRPAPPPALDRRGRRPHRAHPRGLPAQPRHRAGRAAGDRARRPPGRRAARRGRDRRGAGAHAAQRRPDGDAAALPGRAPITRRPRRAAPCTTTPAAGAARPRGGGGLNEITAPVIDDLGRRITAALPEG